MDTEIASKMLSALIVDSGVMTDMKPQCSLDDQKRYLRKYVDTISLDDRKELAQLLARAGYRVALKPCSEGTVINLDTLGAPEIELLYTRMEHMKNNKPAQKYIRH